MVSAQTVVLLVCVTVACALPAGFVLGLACGARARAAQARADAPGRDECGSVCALAALPAEHRLVISRPRTRTRTRSRPDDDDRR